MSHSFVPGTVWIFSNTISCIPSGCYRLEHVEEEFLVFSVGPEISFGLSKDYYAPLLRKVSAARSMRTSPKAFLRRYAQLIQQRPTAPSPPSGMTFCAMTPKRQRQLDSLCQTNFFSAVSAMH